MERDTQDELYYRLALTFVPAIGSKTAKNLLSHYGTAENVFKAPLKELRHIEGLNELKVKGFKDPVVFKQTETELDFIEKNEIKVIFYNSPDYPARLANCIDAPALLFYRGNGPLHAPKTVAIVGTRKNTDYGSKITEDLVEGLQGHDIIVVSGLATGIDTVAHKKSVKLCIPTVGVLGHGFDRMYPASNKNLANEMLVNGGLLTEFSSQSIPDKNNFPMRNRIVAGLCDVTVVIESDVSGGALITAMMANNYNREVAAIPGRVTDSKSGGCNELIRSQVAHLITSAPELLELMNWSDGTKKKVVQKQLFLNLSPEQQKIIDLLQTKDTAHADEIFHHTGLSNSLLAVTLLDLEMLGLLKTLPGKYYRIN